MLMPAEVAFAQAYWQNPYFRHGQHAEATLIEALEIRQELSRLDARSQFILQAKAADFNQRDMAEMCGVSLRTMVRWMTEFTERRRDAA
jgi:DNA-directed RNA polymerase specialized sigma24 family protein